jgi:hypothetical protein
MRNLCFCVSWTKTTSLKVSQLKKGWEPQQSITIKKFSVIVKFGSGYQNNCEWQVWILDAHGFKIQGEGPKVFAKFWGRVHLFGVLFKQWLLAREFREYSHLPKWPFSEICEIRQTVLRRLARLADICQTDLQGLARLADICQMPLS